MSFYSGLKLSSSSSLINAKNLALFLAGNFTVLISHVLDKLATK
jgi:hypothetical protein